MRLSSRGIGASMTEGPPLWACSGSGYRWRISHRRPQPTQPLQQVAGARAPGCFELQDQFGIVELDHVLGTAPGESGRSPGRRRGGAPGSAGKRREAILPTETVPTSTNRPQLMRLVTRKGRSEPYRAWVEDGFGDRCPQRHHESGGDHVQAKAWNNGQHHASGAGYGIKFSREERDRGFLRVDECAAGGPGSGDGQRSALRAVLASVQ